MRYIFYLLFFIPAFVTAQLFTGVAASSRGGDQLPLNSRIIYFGDSQTRMGIFEDDAILEDPAISVSYTNSGYANLTNILAGSGFFVPIEGNQGGNGHTTTQMVARLSTATALTPTVAVILAGTNDLQFNETAAAIQGRLRTIYDAFLNIGCRIVTSTILPRFAGDYELTGPQETVRQSVNAWILSQSGISVYNAEPNLNSASYYLDGIHPNVIGAYRLGSGLAGLLRPMIVAGNMADSVSNNYVTNPDMTGTAGTLNTATGVVSDNWTLFSNNSGGATVVGSKAGDDKQVITISGTYTGDGRYAEMRDITVTTSEAGDVFEGFLDIEILSTATNIATVDLLITGFNADYSQFLMSGQAFYESDHSALQLPAGRYVLRTPPQTVSGVIENFATYVRIIFLDGGSSTAVSGSIKIHKVGVRKIEADAPSAGLLFTDLFPGTGGLNGYNGWFQFMGAMDGVRSGQDRVNLVATAGHGWVNNTSSISNVSNGKVSASILPVATDTYIEFIFRYVDPDNYYVATFRQSDGASEEIGLYKSVGGVVTQLGSNIYHTLDMDYITALTPLPVAIAFNGSTFTATVEDTDYTLTSDSDFTTGKTGLQIYSPGERDKYVYNYQVFSL